MLYYDESICGMDLYGDGKGTYDDDFIWNESMKNIFGQESESDNSYDSDDGDYED